MDLRDDVHHQISSHIGTLRELAAQDTPAQLVWSEIQRVLVESALHLEYFVLPKIPPVKQHLDLLHREEPPKIAHFVGATSGPEPVAEESRVPSFLNNNSRKE